jgi:hypothetical protein
VKNFFVALVVLFASFASAGNIPWDAAGNIPWDNIVLDQTTTPWGY